MPVEKNKVYVLPAGSYMTIGNGRLHLQRRNGGHNCAIDIFLHSLAGEYKHKAIAVIQAGYADQVLLPTEMPTAIRQFTHYKIY